MNFSDQFDLSLSEREGKRQNMSRFLTWVTTWMVVPLSRIKISRPEIKAEAHVGEEVL